mmetsp:Transcript_5683/g.13286  ORF Transcript_5683/g.13286 Transcript_5683/m.13286 type:complete len:207 (-) Transcript_5683:1335-1955(-)
MRKGKRGGEIEVERGGRGQRSNAVSDLCLTHISSLFSTFPLCTCTVNTPPRSAPLHSSSSSSFVAFLTCAFFPPHLNSISSFFHTSLPSPSITLSTSHSISCRTPLLSTSSLSQLACLRKAVPSTAMDSTTKSGREWANKADAIESDCAALFAAVPTNTTKVVSDGSRRARRGSEEGGVSEGVKRTAMLSPSGEDIHVKEEGKGAV